MSAKTYNEQKTKPRVKSSEIEQATGEMTEMTIAEIVTQSEGVFDNNLQDFDILLNAVNTAGLASALNGADADLTVFAPTDDAFVQLANDLGYEGSDESGAYDAIVAGLSELGGGDPLPVLQDVLSYHVSPGEKTLEEIKSSETVETLLAGATITPDGEMLTDNEPDLDDPSFEEGLTDIKASNGTIQGIDRVLIPLDIPGNESEEPVKAEDPITGPDPVKDPLNEPTNGPMDDPAEDPDHCSSDEPVDESIDGLTYSPTDETMDEMPMGDMPMGDTPMGDMPMDGTIDELMYMPGMPETTGETTDVSDIPVDGVPEESIPEEGIPEEGVITDDSLMAASTGVMAPEMPMDGSMDMQSSDVLAPEVLVEAAASGTMDGMDMPMYETMDMSMDAPVDETAVDPMDMSMDAPVDETAVDPMDMPMDVPVDETAVDPMDMPMDVPVDEATTDPMDMPMDAPVDETTVDPMDMPMDLPIDDPIDDPMGQSSGTVDTLYGTEDDDVLFAQADSNRIAGLAGNDVLVGGAEQDIILGGLGDDIVLGNGGSDILSGEGGRDILFGGAADDIIDGGSGKDTIFGNGGSDRIFGGAGCDDIFASGDGSVLDGGMGNDTLWVNGSASTVILRATNGTDTLNGFELGQTKLGLSDGLKFSDLSFEQGQGSSSSILSGGEVLAKVSGASVTDLNAESNFSLV
jgi:uncharacterized surface protein with fasciclin (FAS1) repeats